MKAQFRKRCIAVAAGLIASTALVANAAEPKEALIMPQASKALLLDSERVGDRLIASGEYGIIVYSDDDAKTWQQAKVPTPQMITAIDFVDEKHGWAVAHDGIVLTTADGGATWTRQLDGLAQQKEQNIHNKAKLRTLVDTLQAQKTALRAAGESNSELNSQLDDAEYDLEIAEERLTESSNTPPLLDVYFASKARGFATGAFGKMLSTRDGGKTWEDISAEVPNEDGFHINAITGTANGIIVAVGEMGFVMVSKDAGETWQRSESMTYDGTFFGVITNDDASLIAIAGLRGNVYTSADLGETWNHAKSNTDQTLFGGALVNNTLLFVGAGGAVITSHDSGKNFALYTQASRLGMSSVLAKSDGSYLLVGMGGVHAFQQTPAK